RPPLPDPPRHADRPSRPLGGAVSLAHPGRHPDRAGPPRARAAVRARARPEPGRPADPRGPDPGRGRALPGGPPPRPRPDGGLTIKRADCLRALYPELGDRLVVTIMGPTAPELYDLRHRESFFYLQHAMGLASSIGLGLALNRPEEEVVVLDGDGSVLMNLGGLATLARYRPANLTHIVFDNGSLISTGGFASHTTSGVTDLAAVARGAGCPRVREAQTGFQFMEAVADAFDGSAMTTSVARVEAVGPDQSHMDLALPENAFQFQRHVARRRRARPPS